MGWEKSARRAMRDALALTPASEFCAEEESAESAPETRLQNVELKDWRKSKRGRGELQGGHYVYVLTDVGGKRHSYVGYTPRLEDRAWQNTIQAVERGQPGGIRGGILPSLRGFRTARRR